MFYMCICVICTITYSVLRFVCSHVVRAWAQRAAPAFRGGKAILMYQSHSGLKIQALINILDSYERNTYTKQMKETEIKLERRERWVSADLAARRGHKCGWASSATSAQHPAHSSQALSHVHFLTCKLISFTEPNSAVGYLQPTLQNGPEFHSNPSNALQRTLLRFKNLKFHRPVCHPAARPLHDGHEREVVVRFEVRLHHEVAPPARQQAVRVAVATV